jgi:hypothetical protein
VQQGTNRATKISLKAVEDPRVDPLSRALSLVNHSVDRDEPHLVVGYVDLAVSLWLRLLAFSEARWPSAELGESGKRWLAPLHKRALLDRVRARRVAADPDAAKAFAKLDQLVHRLERLEHHPGPMSAWTADAHGLVSLLSGALVALGRPPAASAVGSPMVLRRGTGEVWILAEASGDLPPEGKQNRLPKEATYLVWRGAPEETEEWGTAGVELAWNAEEPDATEVLGVDEDPVEWLALERR